VSIFVHQVDKFLVRLLIILLKLWVILHKIVHAVKVELFVYVVVLANIFQQPIFLLFFPLLKL